MIGGGGGCEVKGDRVEKFGGSDRTGSNWEELNNLNPCINCQQWMVLRTHHNERTFLLSAAGLSGHMVNRENKLHPETSENSELCLSANCFQLNFTEHVWY